MSNREYLELVNGDLNFTRGNVFVYSALSACADNTLCEKDVLGSYAECRVEYFLVCFFVERKLNDTRSVAKVDKYETLGPPKRESSL